MLLWLGCTNDEGRRGGRSEDEEDEDSVTGVMLRAEARRELRTDSVSGAGVADSVDDDDTAAASDDGRAME
jgi:hypothetical protein